MERDVTKKQERNLKLRGKNREMQPQVAGQRRLGEDIIAKGKEGIIMEKTLHTIQVLAKIGKVLSTIVFVLSIVGAAGCIVGAVCWEKFGNFEIDLGGVTIHNIVEAETGMTSGGVFTACAVGFVLVLGEVFLAKAAQRYFKHELDSGTPFTMEGAKELKSLGIKTIVIPVIAYVAAAIVHGVMVSALQMGGGEFDTDITVNLGLGIMFIIGSLLCKLGTQQRIEKKPEGYYER